MLLFVHIGKTGGTSIRNLLRAQEKPFRAERHWTCERYSEELGREAFAKATTFAVIRHPYDRFRSACRECRLDPNDIMTWRGIANDTAGGQARELMRRQYDSTHIDGKLAVDHLFKFERGLFEVKKKLQLAGQLGHDRQRPHIGDPLSEDAMFWVRTYYRQDFETFGYNTATRRVV